MNSNCKEITPEATEGSPPAKRLLKATLPSGREIVYAILHLGLITAVVLIPAGHATAQLGSMINPDGAFPVAGLALSGKALYGTAQAGGNWGHGAVFAVNTNGTGFACLHSFMGSDGMNPYAAMARSGNMLYGTANGGGGSGEGTVFAIDTEAQIL